MKIKIGINNFAIFKDDCFYQKNSKLNIKHLIYPSHNIYKYKHFTILSQTYLFSIFVQEA